MHSLGDLVTYELLFFTNNFILEVSWILLNKIFFCQVYGVVFVVDASDVNRLEESRKVLHEVKSNLKVSGKPLLVWVVI